MIWKLGFLLEKQTKQKSTQQLSGSPVLRLMALGSQDNRQSEVYGSDGPLTGATGIQGKAALRCLFRRSLNPFQGHTGTSCQATLITLPLLWDLSALAKVQLNLYLPLQDMCNFLHEWAGVWVQWLESFLQILSFWLSLLREKVILGHAVSDSGLQAPFSVQIGPYLYPTL